jgi:hypothetical protein
VRRRILEELILLDLRVRSAPRSPSVSPDQYLSPEIGALVEIDERGVDLWLRDELGGRSRRVRVERSAGMSDELLSLRAVELLRGRLLPVSATEEPQRITTSSERAERTSPPPLSNTEQARFEAALGAGATWTSGLPVTPHLGVAATYLLPYGLGVGAIGELPLARVDKDFIGGGLEIWQFAYGVQLRFSWSPSPLFRFGASTQLGVRQVAFSYEPAPPFSPSSGTELLPLLGLGVHGDVLPWSWLGVRAEVRGAASSRTELLAVTNPTPPVSVEAEGSESSVSVGSQLAGQLSLVARW